MVKKDCPDCDGGTVTQHPVVDGERVTREVPCTRCGGTGVYDPGKLAKRPE